MRHLQKLPNNSFNNSLINQETWKMSNENFSPRILHKGSKRNFMQRNQQSVVQKGKREKEAEEEAQSEWCTYVYRVPTAISRVVRARTRGLHAIRARKREKKRDGGWERAQIQRTRGADKNVARTGDITGSNVTRSRRSSSPVGVQGRKGVIKRRTLHEEVETHPRHGARITIINNYNWFAVVPWST